MPPLSCARRQWHSVLVHSSPKEVMREL
jgi:hypothetical protein